MGSNDWGRGLDLDYERSRDKKVGAELPDDMASIVDCQWDLRLRRDAGTAKRNHQCIFVNAFQEAGPEIVVDSEERADHHLRQVPVHQFQSATFRFRIQHPLLLEPLDSRLIRVDPLSKSVLSAS